MPLVDLVGLLFGDFILSDCSFSYNSPLFDLYTADSRNIAMRKIFALTGISGCTVAMSILAYIPFSRTWRLNREIE